MKRVVEYIVCVLSLILWQAGHVLLDETAGVCTCPINESAREQYCKAIFVAELILTTEPESLETRENPKKKEEGAGAQLSGQTDGFDDDKLYGQATAEVKTLKPTKIEKYDIIVTRSPKLGSCGVTLKTNVTYVRWPPRRRGTA